MTLFTRERYFWLVLVVALVLGADHLTLGGGGGWVILKKVSCKRLSSGELRNGSSLHAGFYDLILFFPVSSLILLLDRCV